MRQISDVSSLTPPSKYAEHALPSQQTRNKFFSRSWFFATRGAVGGFRVEFFLGKRLGQAAIPQPTTKYIGHREAKQPPTGFTFTMLRLRLFPRQGGGSQFPGLELQEARATGNKPR
eukprot:TRINITY_DN9831_c0_g1_i2.p1 TRINITY_DN9831_c0_g1~~TRINITY_DN9831_c0_g1_i2.p1  ORF type:complete len:117 (-),score=9.23 TRINITY_DN9831_c0_g1_i2:232-582(-)